MIKKLTGDALLTSPIKSMPARRRWKGRALESYNDNKISRYALAMKRRKNDEGRLVFNAAKGSIPPDEFWRLITIAANAPI